MASFEDDPLSEDAIDLDRVVLDAEYRGRVLARLRQHRDRMEASPPAAVPSVARALSPED